MGCRYGCALACGSGYTGKGRRAAVAGGTPRSSTLVRSQSPSSREPEAVNGGGRRRVSGACATCDLLNGAGVFGSVRRRGCETRTRVATAPIPTFLGTNGGLG